MKPVTTMVGGSVASWLVATAIVGLRTGLEILLGMLAPLAVASGTLVLVERTYRRHPTRLTALMIKAFAAKMVVFGAYVALVVSLAPVRIVPFVISFTSYFIALHLAEALALRGLFAGGARSSG